MEKKREIAQYRERLDEVLASPELTNEETLKTLVKNQLRHSSLDENEGCSENVVERKTTEVSNFLGMLRSTSVKDKVSKTSEACHGGWKLKQDTEEFRVMYREGPPQGTPFHSLLVEGFVDAPLDACLCVSWESALYRKWWPQYIFPQFKIITSNCLKKVRIGEQISLVRMKVPWPLSTREALVLYFLFDYFQDGLLIVLVNSISDLKSIDRGTHGFTNDEIPEAKDVVRIDLVGGFALRKVAENRSFFRLILNMDMKLDFVPPSVINFISRQLIGNGFKLYQKALASVSSYSDDYSKALEEPLRIHKALYSTKESEEPVNAKELKNDAIMLCGELFIQGRKDGQNEMEQKVHNINRDGDSLENKVQVTDRNVVGEIEEEESEETTHLDKDDKGIDQFLTNEVPEHWDIESLQTDAQVRDINIVGEIEEEDFEGSICSGENDKDMDKYLDDETPQKSHVNGRKAVSISPGVEQALETLEKPTKAEMGVVKDSISSEDRVHPDIEVPKKEEMEKNLQESRKTTGILESRCSGSNSDLRDGDYNKIAPASLEDDLSYPDEVNQVAVSFSRNGTAEIPILDNSIHDDTTIDGRRKLSS